MSYLFGFKGRINRAKIWLFLLITIIVSWVLIAIAAFGFDWSETLRSFLKLAEKMQPGDQLDFTKLACPKMMGMQSYVAIAAMGLIYLVLIWASLAIYIKRLHDRNKSAWWLVLYWLVPMALQAYAYWSAPSFVEALFMNILTPLGYLAYGIAMLISFWVFVELFFFRGTKGENRYGPNPLAK